jgi:hypothetical protein
MSHKWEVKEIIKRGNLILGLLKEYPEVLNRLSKHWIITFGEKLNLFELMSQEKDSDKSDKKGLSSTERIIAMEAKDWIMVIRNVAKKSGVGQDVLATLGVGSKINPTSTDSVVTGLKDILNTIEKSPELIKKLYLKPEEVEEGNDLKKALVDKDKDQIKKVLSNRENTRKLKFMHTEIENIISLISRLGILEYRQNYELREKFHTLEL